ncbi:hypothetical protein B484DRAFT_456483 [Ochromonadaceae sp. CCMP2298]|nr:hypothetical protein B484DRAFT_456483 [Ochromonadaceae sp. CCMP2298]
MSGPTARTMLGGSDRAGGSLTFGLPDGLLRQAVLPFLAVEEAVRLHSAVCICEPQDRARLLCQISGAVLEGSLDFILSDASVAWMLRTRVGVRKAAVYWSEDCDRCLESVGAEMAGDVLGHLEALRVVGDYPVSKLFQYCSKIRSLDLSKQLPDWAGKETLQAVATHCTGLLALDLSYTHVSCAWVVPLVQRCSLTALRLYSDELSDFTDESIVRLLEHCADLVELALPPRAGFTLASARVVAQSCPDLQILDVQGCAWLTDEWIRLLSQHCQGLRDLRCVNVLTDAGITALSSNCSKLEVLHVQHCKELSGVGILELASNCPHLQSLNVLGCRISGDSIVAVAERCRGLRVLVCSQVTDAAIIALSLHCTGLQSLSVITAGHHTAGAIITLAERCAGLKELDIDFRPGGATDALLAALANCAALERLVLSGCEEVTDAAICSLRGEGLRFLWVDRETESLCATLLQSCPHLRVVSIGDDIEDMEDDTEDSDDDEEEEEEEDGEDGEDGEEEAEADDGKFCLAGVLCTTFASFLTPALSPNLLIS